MWMCGLLVEIINWFPASVAFVYYLSKLGQTELDYVNPTFKPKQISQIHQINLINVSQWAGGGSLVLMLLTYRVPNPTWDHQTTMQCTIHYARYMINDTQCTMHNAWYTIHCTTPTCIKCTESPTWDRQTTIPNHINLYQTLPQYNQTKLYRDTKPNFTVP